MRNYATTFNPFFDQLFGCKVSDSKFMLTNIKETDSNYEISIEVPNVNKEDIKVSLMEGKLTVKVNKAIEEEENVTYLLKERRSGTFERSYYVGENVKFKDISAKLENGVLTLTITKVKEEEKEEFIEIK